MPDREDRDQNPLSAPPADRVADSGSRPSRAPRGLVTGLLIGAAAWIVIVLAMLI